jgi:hypothetical protein
LPGSEDPQLASNPGTSSSISSTHGKKTSDHDHSDLERPLPPYSFVEDVANGAPSTPDRSTDVKLQVRAFNADKTENTRGLNPEEIAVAAGVSNPVVSSDLYLETRVKNEVLDEKSRGETPVTGRDIARDIAQNEFIKPVWTERSKDEVVEAFNRCRKIGPF